MSREDIGGVLDMAVRLKRVVDPWTWVTELIEQRQSDNILAAVC